MPARTGDIQAKKYGSIRIASSPQGRANQGMGQVREHGFTPIDTGVIAVLRGPMHGTAEQHGDDKHGIEQHLDRRNQRGGDLFDHDAEQEARTAAEAPPAIRAIENQQCRQELRQQEQADHGDEEVEREEVNPLASQEADADRFDGRHDLDALVPVQRAREQEQQPQQRRGIREDAHAQIAAG